MSETPPWPPPGWPEPQYPQPLRPVGSGLILALGIMGLLICGVFGPFAAVMGGNAVAAIDRGEADPSERGPANTGRVLGIISTVLLALSVAVISVAVSHPAFRQGLEKSYYGGSSR